MFRWSFVLICTMIGATAWATPNDDLFTACKQGDLAGVERALGAGASATGLDVEGHSALEAAVFWPEIVQRLLAAGADPNAGSYPALVTASNVYAVETMKLLLDAGADPNRPGVVSEDGGAPIRAMIAAEEAKGKKANKTLLAAYRTALAAVKPGTSMSFLPLRQVVAQTNCVPCLKLLLERGADPKLVTDMGGNLLHLFASFGMTQADRKKAFIDGAPILVDRYKMKVPAWYLDVDQVGNGTPEQMLALLLPLGLDMNARNNIGNTPLLDVLAGGVGSKSEVGVALVKAGADVNVEHDKFGKAILIATRTGMVEVVKAMVAAGADVNTEGKGYDENAQQFVQGFSPLIIAAMRDDLPMVEALLGLGATPTGGLHGASFNIKSGCHTGVRGKGAIYFAIENDNAAMIERLAKVGPWSSFSIDQLRTSTSSVQGNYQVTTIRCLADGTYSPSDYADAVGSSHGGMLRAAGW
jgi:ankyrin repeat protein